MNSAPQLSIPGLPRGKRALPELLAPAGDWDCARAAVENGADAIYFGLERFNARMRAKNFTAADLPELMSYLHRRGVRGYVTLNTLVFTDELAEAGWHLRSVIQAGVDAVIVQDIGLCRLIRRLSPDFPIHASTQMTITSPAGVRLAEELGCSVVVLARECSIQDIERIRTEMSEGNARTVPLEVFVHGALCVAYSGQCLTSESLGGRSANRGECAQACRMPYELITDGRRVDLGDRRYLLSPQDLAGIGVLPELVRSGVASLKIEGRLKSAEYVANVTQVYRRALDRLAESPAPEPNATRQLWEENRYALEMAFSRGLYTGWFRGINNQELVHARFGKKRGVLAGRVVRVLDDAVAVRLEAPLQVGDGVVFDGGRPDQNEEGGRVFGLKNSSAGVVLRFGRGAIRFERIRVGDRVWKTSDPGLERRLKQTFAPGPPRHRRALWMEAHGGCGLPLTLIVRDEEGSEVSVESHVPLVAAKQQPLTTERVREQLGRLGGTAFRLESLDNRLEGRVMIPVSELNRLRRDALQLIEQLRAAPRRWQLTEVTPESICGSVRTVRCDAASADAPVTLIPLVRTMDQLRAFDGEAGEGVERVYCEFEDLKRYREAVRWAQERGQRSDSRIRVYVAPPRIFKPGEDWVLKQVESCGADGYLVRNYDHLFRFQGGRCVGDFSLNIANPLSARYLMDRFDLERVTASYDLNAAQLEGLLHGVTPGDLEVTLHQHMPMFHMEHCVFCAFLSSGTDFRTCGRPCDRYQVRLRDRVGLEHPLKADAGCRNTVFNGKAQTGAEFYERLRAAGARHFRIEFLSETEEETRRIWRTYQTLVRGGIRGREVWKQLNLMNQIGVTRGPLRG